MLVFLLLRLDLILRQYLSLSYIEGQENEAGMLIFQDIISTKVKVEERYQSHLLTKLSCF